MEFVGSKLCMIKDIGQNNTLFGGNMLAWIDEISAIFAYKQTKEKRVVTLRFGELVFKRQVHPGDIVEFFCYDIKKGKTSITFSIKGLVNQEPVFETEATFVAVDEDGNKKEIDVFKI